MSARDARLELNVSQSCNDRLLMNLVPFVRYRTNQGLR